MKILLVNPYFDSHIITPPLGLGYLSSYLKKAYRDVNISIIDCLVNNINNAQLVEILKEEKPDMLGLTTYSMFYEEVRHIARNIKKINSNIRVVIGGPHVSALPKFSLEDTNADFAVFGEGEQTLKELVDKLIDENNNFSEINGLCYRDSNNETIINPSRPLIKNISDIPWPDWQLINPNRYPPAPHGGLYKKVPIAPIVTTRGCPFKCTFCGSNVIWNGVIRYRTKNDVVNEMEYLMEKYNVQEFHFEDDNFTLSKEHATAICEEIIKRGFNIPWACPNGIRIDTVDDELLKIMKRSGCYLLAFGIESGSQEILNSVNKPLDKKIIYDILNKAKKIGIETWGFFIIGLPGETKKTFTETLHFAKTLPLDRAQFCNFTPIPGTPLFELWLEKQNIKDLSDIKWSGLNFFTDCVYPNEELSANELSGFQRKAFLSFYLRPKIALNMLSKIRPRQSKFMLKRLKAYIFK